MAGSKPVFLSYASQDAVAAAALGGALRAAGIDTWFDQSELRGGDAWDQRIRRQIKECRLFIAIISRNANERSEGYFRLEWKLAVDRSHLIASDENFILPVLIDDTRPADARIPDRFHEFQWMRLQEGGATPEFVARVAEILANPSAGASSKKRAELVTGETIVRSRGSRRRSPVLWITTILILLIAAGAALHFSRASAPKPYSASDRRMTFAILPFTAPQGDQMGVRIAAATTENSVAALQRNTIWASSVEYAAFRDSVARATRIQDIAKVLDVHFLVRGTVIKGMEGYSVQLMTVDGDDERVLGDRTIKIPPGSPTPVRRDDYDDAFGWLIYYGMKAEVERVATKPESELDVRDLIFRAQAYRSEHLYSDPELTYRHTQHLLEEALKRSPDDVLANRLVAEVNLCDCIMAWAHDPAKETAIGEAAVEKLKQLDPQSPYRGLRIELATLRGRMDELLVLADDWMRAEPEELNGFLARVFALIRLGRTEEALTTARRMEPLDQLNTSDLPAYLAAAEYAAGQYEDAARHARIAISRMSDAQLKSAADGEVLLTLAAAEARRHRVEQARLALADFWKLVPQARTLNAIRQWMYPTAVFYGYEPLFDGLRMAGIE